MDFLKVALYCDVLEGYGLTETAATTTRAFPGDKGSSGYIGPPGPVNEVKLIDVPEMGYTSQDQPLRRGEICIRGANVFTEYYKGQRSYVLCYVSF